MKPSHLVFLLACAASASAAPAIEYAIAIEECDGKPIRKSTLRMEFIYQGDSTHPAGYSSHVYSESGAILSSLSSTGFPDNSTHEQVGKGYIDVEFSPHINLPGPKTEEKQTEVSGETFRVIRHTAGALPGVYRVHDRSFAGGEYAPRFVQSYRPLQSCTPYTKYSLKIFQGKPVDSGGVASAEAAIGKAYVGVRRAASAASAPERITGPNHRADGRKLTATGTGEIPSGPTFRKTPR